MFNNTYIMIAIMENFFILLFRILSFVFNTCILKLCPFYVLKRFHGLEPINKVSTYKYEMKLFNSFT